MASFSILMVIFVILGVMFFFGIRGMYDDVRDFKLHRNGSKNKTILGVMMVAVAIVSCSHSPNLVQKSEQEKFFDIMRNARESDYKQPNDIKRKEYQNTFSEELYHYLVDTICPIQSWKAKIERIKTSQFRDDTILEFDLVMEVQEYQNVTFGIEHIVKTADLPNDFLYKKVSNIRDFSTVQFDGFPRTLNEGSLKWNSIFDDHIRYPHIYFCVTDIAPLGQKDTLSDNMETAYKLALKSIDLIRRNVIKELTKKEYDILSQDNLTELNATKELLTEDEVEMLQFILNEAANNVINGY